MNTLDIIIVALIIIPGVWVGIAKGFIFQAVTIVSLYLSAIIGAAIGHAIGGWSSSHFGISPALADVLAFVLIFIITYILLFLLGKLLRKILKQTGGRGFDIIAGIVLGIVKYTLLVGLVAFLFSTLNNETNLVSSDTLDSSKAFCFVKDAAESIFPFIKSMIGGINF